MAVNNKVNFMKKDIHPAFNKESKASCVCGNNFTIGSTLQELHVELCSKCHPFYTGKQKLVDSAQRIEKFHAKSAKKDGLSHVKGKTAKRATKTAKKVAKKENQ